MLLTVTHRLVVIQVKESPDVLAGWYCLPDLAEPRLSTVKNESRLHVNHSKSISLGTVWEAAVATAGDRVQTDRFGFHTMLQCKATQSAFRVDMNEPGFVSDVRVCVSVPWGSARVAVHLTPLPLCF